MNFLASTASVALALIAMPVSATEVVGNINADTRWTVADSPYELIGDVTVAPHATLTIEPGVSVIPAATDSLGSGANTALVELIVRGALVAEGTEAAPIEFGATGAASWAGISVEVTAPTASFAHVHLYGAQTAIALNSPNAVAFEGLMVEGRAEDSTTGLLVNGTPVSIVGSEFRQLGATPIEILNDAGVPVSIVDTEFSDSGAVIVASGQNAVVQRSTFLRGSSGLFARSGASLTVESSVFVGPANSAIRFLQAADATIKVSNNTIAQLSAEALAPKGVGISVEGVENASLALIRNNSITGFETGILVEGALAPSQDHNNVWSNGTDYEGTSPGLGSISVNPLFTTQPGLDAAEVFEYGSSMGVGSYGSDFSWTRTIEAPNGTAAMLLRLEILSTESCCDRVSVSDGQGNVIGTYGGVAAFYEINVQGAVAELSFTSDSSVERSGFYFRSMTPFTSTLGNTRLLASSPLIDVGNDLDVPASDRDGTDRSYDGDVNGTPRVDIGAYEWHSNLPPFAVAGADQLILPGTTVHFTGLASRDPDGSIDTYAWDFGDGTSTDGPEADHTFLSVGVFNVVLTVTDDQGLSATDTLVVDVRDNLPPIADAGTDQVVAVGALVSFNGGGSSDPDGTVTSYTWDFADGSAPGQGRSVTHVFPRAGVYLVSLTVADNRGATSTDDVAVVVGVGTPGNLSPVAHVGGPYATIIGGTIEFDGTASADADGTVETYAWDFGDGNTASGAEVEHQYVRAGAYLVRLTVTDDGGAQDDAVALVRVSSTANAAPHADIGGPYAGTTNETIAFDATGSADMDGTIVDYAWDFGDGTSATGASPAHAYAQPGAFLVRLVVTDNAGAQGEAVALVQVTNTGNQSPVAHAGGPYSGRVGVPVVVDASASSDADGSVVRYIWDFGDGASGSGVSTSHAYATAGSYLLRLTVHDESGAIDDDAVLVTIRAPDGQTPNAAPVAHAGGPYVVLLGETVTLDATASSDTDGEVVDYSWVFGDESEGTGRTVEHTYASPGTYLAQVTVTDDAGDTDKAVALVTVKATTQAVNLPPTADAGGPYSANIGETVKFDGTASTDDGMLVAFRWDFGDGETASGATVEHSFGAAGTYLVALTVTDDEGATARSTTSVRILRTDNQAPTAKAGPSQVVAPTERVRFDGSASTDNDGELATFSWDFGDGAKAMGPAVEHSYDRAGTYIVRLVVTDDEGATDQDLTAVTVVAETVTPQTSDSGCSATELPQQGLPSWMALLLALPLLRRRRR